MTQGLAATFAALAKTKNDAATAVLLPALDSSLPEVRCGALRALLDRRSPAGQRVILNRLAAFDEEQMEVMHERRGRLSTAMRDALLGGDEQDYRNACQAIVLFREYDLAAVLVSAAEDASNPHAALAAATLRGLAGLLYGELSAPRDYSERRDPQLVRRHIMATLEHSIGRFGKHKRPELVESFLTLSGRDNLLLKKILSDPYHECYLCTVDLLKRSEQPGVIRLVLGFLDDSATPSAGVSVIGHRSDFGFVEALLNKLGNEPGAAVLANLRRLKSIPWLHEELPLLDGLGEQGQCGAVELATRSAMRRSDALSVISHLLGAGTLGGRRAAATALPQYSGDEANHLALAALEDDDPEVQAIVLSQLRQRGIPGAVSQLLDRAASPHPQVREAVREALAEFTFARFCAAYDTLDENVRPSTALLVKKVDSEAVEQLADELRAKSRTRRLRGLAIAQSMQAVPQVESDIIALLADTDHMVRSQAATALEQADSPAAVATLREALADTSVAVQEAAENSLEQLLDRRAKRSGSPADPLPVEESV